MPLVPLRVILNHAAENNYGVAAFNVNNMEQIQAIMEAAEQTDSPVIVQASRGARKYSQDAYLKHLMLAAAELYPQIPIVMHQDHGNSVETCMSAIDNGFTSVMMDGSLREDMQTPSDYAYNVRVTKAVADLAHACGVSVEGELGCLGSLESGYAGEEDGSGASGKLSMTQMLTDPEQAKDFVLQTGIDALAIAIGTSHGACKFLKPPTSQVLAIDRVAEIHKKIPNTHLVMHGASSVPMELLEKINRYGGNLPLSYGVPVAEIQKAIVHGVRKVNVDTDLRLAATAAIREHLANSPEDFDPRKYLSKALAGMQEICKQRFDAFGSSGYGEKIKTKSLAYMQDFYSHNACVKKSFKEVV